MNQLKRFDRVTLIGDENDERVGTVVDVAVFEQTTVVAVQCDHDGLVRMFGMDDNGTFWGHGSDTDPALSDSVLITKI